MGNNNKHLGGSREQRKSFWDPGRTDHSLLWEHERPWERVWETSSFIDEEKGIKSKRLRDHGSM